MDKQKVIAKLISRKFWTLVAALIGSVLAVNNFDENSIAQITSIIGGFGAVIVYIFSEATIDVANIKKDAKKNNEKSDE